MGSSASASCECLSHPARKLETHLGAVADHCRRLAEGKVLAFDHLLPHPLFTEVATHIGLYHDVGKATRYFQDYITTTDTATRRRLRRQKETHHGLLSALFCYHGLRELLATVAPTDVLECIPLLGYLIVKRHHGNLQDALAEILVLRDPATRAVLTRQVGSMDPATVTGIDGNLTALLDPAALMTLCDDIIRVERPRLRKLKRSTDLRIYFLHQLLYSFLLDGDKMDAAFRARVTGNQKPLSANLVDRYKTTRGYDHATTPLNTLRNRIYSDVTGTIRDEKLLSLNAPTSAGKTLTAISYALKLRERVQRTARYTPRIIYCLPFLSIIDQNFDEIHRMLATTLSPPTIPSTLLLKHHHLADITYRTESKEFEPHKSQLLTEGWNAELIVTTFVQLFHSILSNRNHALRKFHNIANSIVILDEVQSIPHKYWLLLRTAIQFLSATFNTHFILVTATLPLLLSPADGITELVPNHTTHFRALDRVTLNLAHTPPISVEEFKHILLSAIRRHPTKDFLIVLNTVTCCRDIHTFLADHGHEAYYLSGHVIPRDRLDRIRQIQRDPARKIIVSTQVVEAGVDIDADITYRDFAPLDSIIQVAGRCNRHGSRGRGKVFIYQLVDDRTECWRYIYDSFLIGKTLETLGSRDCIPEPALLELSDDYFTRVRATQSTAISRALLAHLTALEFTQIAQKFRLIDYRAYRINVFVEADARATSTWARFEALTQIPDPFRRHEAFLAMRGAFYDYVVHVDQKLVAGVTTRHGRIFHLPRSHVAIAYSPTTGIIPQGGAPV